MRIFGITRSRAARAIWMAEELGLAYQQVPVDYQRRDTRSADFLSASLMGRIPAIDDDGLYLSESIAINLYLARRHADAPIAPRGLVEEGRCLSWSLFAVTELEGHALTLLMHGREMPEPRRDRQRLARARGAIRPPLAAIERTLQGDGPMAAVPGSAQDWLLGDRFTVADLNVAAILDWARAQPDVLEAFPATAGWLARCFARPAYERLNLATPAPDARD